MKKILDYFWALLAAICIGFATKDFISYVFYSKALSKVTIGLAVFIEIVFFAIAFMNQVVEIKENK